MTKHNETPPLGGENMRVKQGFENFINYLKVKGYADETIRIYSHFLNGAVSHCPIKNKKVGDLKLTDIAYVQEAGKDHGETGPHKAVSVFKMYLKFLDESGVDLPFDWENIEGVDPPENEQSWLTFEEFEELVGKIPVKYNFCGLRMRAFVELLFATGLRRTEAKNIRLGDIDWEGQRISIKNAKTKKREHVYFTRRAARWVKEYLDARPGENPYLWVERTGETRWSSPRSYWVRNRKKWGISEEVTFHTFRRSFVTHLLRRGADIKTVQRLARHASPQTTLQHYAMINDEEAEKVYREVMEEGST